MRRVAVIAVLAVTLPNPLVAQLCEGTAPFSVHPAHAGLDASFSPDINRYGVNASAGLRLGMYGTIEGSLVEFNNDIALKHGVQVNLVGGWAIDANAEKTLQFCPRLLYQYLEGPDIQTVPGELQNNTDSWGAGAALGGTITLSRSVDIIPFANANYIAAHQQLAVADIAFQNYDYYFLGSLGIGVVIMNRVNIVPSVSIPAGREVGRSFILPNVSVPAGIVVGRSAFNIAVSIGFGPKSRVAPPSTTAGGSKSQ